MDKKDDSMENLQIDDEDEKNVSAEDILGGKTLLMSDSDDDGSPASKQISPKYGTQRIDDSDDEEQSLNQLPGVTANSLECPVGELGNNIAAKPKKKISAIIDTDSEDEQEKRDKNRTTSNSELENIYENKELGMYAETNPKKKKKISAIIDTDSEEEEQKTPLGEPTRTNKKNQNRKNRLESADETTTQSSDEESINIDAKNKLKGIVDSESDSESERSHGEEPRLDEENADGPTEKVKKNKPMRASAKKALDEMQAIQSEQQRLHREAHVHVPYHQPKPRTLKEFLGRRTINKPLAIAMAGGSPMPGKKEPRRSLALRMNSEELQAYAKLMEDRAKEAAEFFKSESETEAADDDNDGDNIDDHDGDNNRDNGDGGDEGVKPEEATISEDKNDENQSEIITAEIIAAQIEDTAVLESNSPNVDVGMKYSAAVDLEVEDIPQEETSKVTHLPGKPVLVTEILELPRIDLNTLHISPTFKPSTPRISEAIRRLKNEKSCDVSPSLRGDANMVIDLETGDMFAKKPTGVDDLLNRLMKTREAKKHKTTETVNILSTAHGKLELSKVSIHLHEEEPVNKEQKPGAAYQKMQEQLKTLITKKRMEDLRKKQAEEIDDEFEQSGENEMDIDEEYEPEDKPCQNQVNINDDEEIIDEEIADCETEEEPVEVEIESDGEVEQKADTNATERERTSSSESDQESEKEENTQASKRKNRIIRAFQDDNSDEDDVDLLQTPKTNNATPVTATQLQLSAQKLFDAEIQRTASDEEKELLGLCSGRFTQSQISSAAPTLGGAFISQIPITQKTASSQAPDELESLCSGAFETQPTSLPAPEVNKILSSEEEPVEELQAEKPRQKKLTKKRPKKAKLGFSDDEESDQEETVNISEDQPESEVEELPEEVPESFVDYDSEENEIVVQMTKNDRKLRAANFVEKEAELSESEWGSADEDEKNMDKYDIELGDDDEFDREKLRHELGQIHARKMLDQDIREVRKIQEMLFEDDEGAVRQRQFRWKNAENGLGFSIDDPRNENVDGEANEGSGDEENEHLWRKIRYEREQLLLEKGLKGDEAASPVTNTNTAGRKITIITAKKTTMEVKKSSPFLISKGVAATQQQRPVRGSFLVRDKETLTKLAGLTKGAAGDVDGSAGTVSIKSVKAKNFVFATLTEEEHESQKRKAAELLNSSSDTGTNFMKKPRIEPRREKCLIDQLL